MARITTARTTFAEIACTVEYDGRVTFRDYAVEVRQGQVRRSIGTVHGTTGRGVASSWYAVPVGAQASTRRYPTRRAALDALIRREDFRDTSIAA